MPLKYEHIGKVIKIDVEGLRRWWSSSWSNSASNHLGPLPEASDGPEGQEPPVRAVGGQGELREVTQLLCKLEI